MTFKLLSVCTILLCLHNSQSVNTITKITDDDFLRMTIANDYIIIFFTKKNCAPCETMEHELLSVRGELEEALDATVAKIYDSKLVRVYSPSKEPALVFFRHGIPLLYLGEVNGELILHTFVENKEPTVKELNDDNFEHLTQATTGSTTGDWFVMFYSKTCPSSRGMTACWEAVGAALRAKMNVARINVESPGFYTSRRFGISYTPSFVLLHHGYMYKYTSKKLDVDSLVGFARNFRQMPSEKIPLPPSPMDFLLNNMTEFLEENAWVLQTGLFGIVLGLIGVIYVGCINRKKKRAQIEQQEDEESEEESSSETEPEHEKKN